MFTNEKDDGSNGGDSAAALIDSYFLPGGILDPEDAPKDNAPDDHHTEVIDSNAALSTLRSRLDTIAVSSNLRQAVQHQQQLTPGGIHDSVISNEPTGVSALHLSDDHVIGGRPILFNSTIASPPSRQGTPSEHHYGLLGFSHQQGISSPPLTGFSQDVNHSSSGSNLNAFIEESTLPMRMQQDTLAGMSGWLPSSQNQFNSAPAPAPVDGYSSLLNALQSSSSAAKNGPNQHLHPSNEPPTPCVSGGSSHDGRNLLKPRSQNPWGKEGIVSSKMNVTSNISNPYANAVRKINSVGSLAQDSQPRQTQAFPGVPSSTATTDTTRSTATISHRQTNKNSNSFRPPPGFDPHRSREESNLRNRPISSQTNHFKHPPTHTLDHRRSARNDSHVYHHHQSNHNGPVSAPVENSQQAPSRSRAHFQQQPQSHQQSNAHHHHQQSQQINHQQDGDYDMLSVTSKSSRGVPSTIYVNQDEDAVSNSEDTLTVCADSVPDVSTAVHTGQHNIPKNNGGVKSESERMDVVEETSATEKKTKTKRHKKKKKKRSTNSSSKIEDHSSQAKSYPSEEKIVKLHELETNQKPKENKYVYKEVKSVEAKDKQNPTITSQTPLTSSTIIHRKPGKKVQSFTSTKHISSHDQRHVRTNLRDDSPKKAGPPISVKPRTPREPLSMTVRKATRQLRPKLLGTWVLLLNGTKTVFKTSLQVIILLLPKKERFWFILPLFCVMIDFSFLAISLIFKTIGRIIYYILVFHKLALLELKESDTAGFCYTVTCTYPQFSQSAMATLPFLPNGTEFVVWYVIVRWLCRPIEMVDTYVYRQKIQERRTRTLEMMKRVRNGETGNAELTMRDVTNIVSDESKEDNQYLSDRVRMANHFLNVIRKLTPLQILLEGAVRGEGLIMTLSGSERILLGYCFVVLRSGYLFSPLVWISWTIQMVTILFFPLNAFWGHYLFLVGLASIRMSHYAASVDDLKARPSSATPLFN